MHKLNEKGVSRSKILTILAVGVLWICIIVPTFVRVSIAANEAHALTQMQKLTQACEKFKAAYGQYPNDAERLTEFTKEGLTSPGYHYQYEFLNKASFALVALPDNYLTGKNSFYGDNDLAIIKVVNQNNAPLITEGDKMGAKHISLARLKMIIKEKHKIDKAPSLVAMDKTKASINIANEPAGIDRESKGNIKGEVRVALLKADKISEKIRDIKQGNVSEEEHRLPVLADIAKNPPYEFEFFVRDLEGVSFSPPNSVATASNDNMSRSENLLVQKIIRNTLFSFVKQNRADSSIARSMSNTATPVMGSNSSIGNPAGSSSGTSFGGGPSTPSGPGGGSITSSGGPGSSSGSGGPGAPAGSGGDDGGIRQRLRSGRR